MWKLFCVGTFIKVLLCVDILLCHPLRKREDFDSRDTTIETKLPNGTIVGKYNYTDNDGNPIEVKYYADDSSYGVELKSVKVQTSSTNLDTQYSNVLVPKINSSRIIIRDASGNKGKYTKYKSNDKANEYQTTSSDYEIFSQKEMKAPKVCANEKVRIYLNTEKRIARKAVDSVSHMSRYGREFIDEMSKYCEQLE